MGLRKKFILVIMQSHRSHHSLILWVYQILDGRPAFGAPVLGLLTPGPPVTLSAASVSSRSVLIDIPHQAKVHCLVLDNLSNLSTTLHHILILSRL